MSVAGAIATIGLKSLAYGLTGSVGLLSDAIESIVNLVGAIVALAMLTIAARPPDEDHHFGHSKAEYFSSGVEGALILFAAIAIIWSAVQRIVSPQPLEQLGVGMLIAALAAGANFAAARVMLKVARQHDSITIEADAKHLMTDVWTTAGILVGLAVVVWMPQWSILDPVMAIAVAVHILFTGFDLLRRSADGLMDVALPEKDVARVEALIRAELPPAASYHALRTRKAGARRFLELHLLVPGELSVAESHALCDRIEASLHAHFAKAHVTIHVEPNETSAPHQ
jgi:cation diffusion facilitator family transporter